MFYLIVFIIFYKYIIYFLLHMLIRICLTDKLSIGKAPVTVLI
ncbi:hypothetical protein [Klebsiella pneumoniae IS22]|nr:hypothetical protein [Klebsiella pneumoniae IS22]